MGADVCYYRCFGLNNRLTVCLLRSHKGMRYYLLLKGDACRRFTISIWHRYLSKSAGGNTEGAGQAGRTAAEVFALFEEWGVSRKNRVPRIKRCDWVPTKDK
jgi:hypothetical protein